MAPTTVRSPRANSRKISPNSSLDFFKVRRCQIKIRRDPTFPGCLYSEMKMCLAPCFAGCSKEEYDAEVQRLVQFLDTERQLPARRRSSRNASVPATISTSSAPPRSTSASKSSTTCCAAQPDLARRIQDLNAVILQRAAEDQTIAAYAVRGGRLAEPCFIRFAEIAGQPRSAEQIFRDYLERPLRLDRQ